MAEEDIEFMRKVRTRYEESETAELDNRKLALDDLRHLNGEQWPEKIAAEREADGRPCLVINRLPGFVDQVVGDQRQNRPRIKVRPVDSKSDPEIARILEGLIRSIEYASHADSTYDTAFEQAAGGGFGYIRILKDYAGKDTFDQDLLIKRIPNPFSVHFDPQVQEVDYSDARYCFVSEVIRKEEFTARFPKGSIPHDWETSQMGSTYEGWFLGEKVRIAEYWERRPEEKVIVQLSTGVVLELEVAENAIRQAAESGLTPPKIVKKRVVKTFEVYQYIVSGSEILDGPTKCDSEYIPIVPVLGKELYVDGKKILRGVIRHAKDSQRMYNYWRSTVTEQVALAPKSPYLATPEQVEGLEEIWRNANRKSYSYLPYHAVPNAPVPTRQFPTPVPQGAFTEAQVAIDDMKATTGLYDASLGARSNETSGIAIAERKREGDVSTFAFIDNLSRAIQHVGRILVDMSPKVYDTERIIRIMNKDGTQKQITINQAGLDENELPVLINDITVGKYDVVVEAGPSYTTQRQESAAGIVSFMQAVPGQAPLMADLAAKNMDWPDADEISKRLKKTLPDGLAEPDENEAPKQPQPNPAVELEKEKLKLEYAKLDLEKMKMELEKFKIEAEVEKERLKFAGVGAGGSY